MKLDPLADQMQNPENELKAQTSQPGKMKLLEENVEETFRTYEWARSFFCGKT